ncbi:DNA ligase D [Enterovirga aerilata]|uniref:DNA ligase (ATP) n=1 Tax=Enterovirga aerilata TaxID=2730920 RepID=A0A849I5L5_9HYPH|nr:DNA ligase D [Enterovirga sp. DB1703]NNM72621.1 DNA ligase D [Enterovirga sp. DB1703]
MAKLAAYLAKRDFEKTPEPKGGPAKDSGNSFVIQKHAATRLHYDLRLELDGVMLSWAVTKGPSLILGEKRLAVHVEDHPIEYNGFEGTIPKGQYGGGTVLIWDRGRWEPEGDPRKGMAKGHLDFRLDGEKLHGRFHLVRLKPRPREKQEAWLLIKSDDEFARHPGDPDILEEMPLSVATGRSLDEIANDRNSAVWNSNRGMAAEERKEKRAEGKTAAKKASRKAGGEERNPRGDEAASDPNGEPSPDVAKLAKGGTKALMPETLEPCLATLVDQVPRGPNWIHEIKWDGYRLLAFKSGKTVRMLTRRGHDWTARFPNIAEAVSALPVETAILDGEAVIVDENGVSDFSALQNALSDEHGRVAKNAVFYAFDLLYLDGHDLRTLPLEERKARLGALVPPAKDGFLRLSEHIEADGAAMVRSACQLGLEGVISKRRDRPYRSGRGEDWLKTKCTERQEFVVAGYVPSTVSARAVGSLVLGYYEGGELKHAGKTGTGFTAESAREIYRKLEPLKRASSPFPAKLAAVERRGVVWVEPKLVAEVEFRGWTADRHLRHASFKGLRDDKTADEVVREVPKDKVEVETAPPPRRAASIRSKCGGEVAGVALTHADRVLWDEGITKLDLARFYEEIADWILPHVAGRPLSLVRCPNGAEKGCFFQKHSWAGLGDAIRRETIRDEGGKEEVLYVEDIRGIVSLVQASVLEIHPWGATIGDVDRPNRITMDLDPGPGVAWTDVIAAARDVRERLRGVGLESFVKTTGGKGLHVVVPLTPKADWTEAKTFAHALALAMEADAPDRYIAKASKQARKGLIYVDYLRNGRGATAISAYSTRARPGAPVSVPLAWSELSPDLAPNHFTIANLGERLAKLKRDPWAEITRIDQLLPTAEKPRRARKRAA